MSRYYSWRTCDVTSGDGWEDKDDSKKSVGSIARQFVHTNFD